MSAQRFSNGMVIAAVSLYGGGKSEYKYTVVLPEKIYRYYTDNSDWHHSYGAFASDYNKLYDYDGKLNIPREQMAMIYNGYNDWFRPIDKCELPKAISQKLKANDYFFFLGNTDPKKNTERTLIAYSKYLTQSAIKRKLLMADLDPEYLNGIIERNGIGNIRDNIIMPGYIINSDLPYIYNNAFAFLYTSLRESFGIPLLEAMACGIPVITSNTSSMPEIGGKDAILVNPEDSNEITTMMLRLESDESFYRQQKHIGLERAKLFSWKKTAENLLKLYMEVYQEIRKK